MKQLLGFLGALLVTFLLATQLAVAAPPETLAQTGRVVIVTEGDVAIPPGDHADVVLVVNGTAAIEGEANTVIAIDGAIELHGARIETVVAINSPVEVGAGTVVLGDVLQVDSLVHQSGDAEVSGEVRDLASVLLSIGAVLAPALVLIWLGFGLATLVAGLALAGLAGRQVRSAAALVSREPFLTFGVGLLGLIGIPLVAFALMATIVGAPLGVAILIQVLPLLAYAGYLVGGIWLGERLLGRAVDPTDSRRPYAAALLGIVVLQVVSLIPVLGIVSAVISIVGFGAILQLAWRTLRSQPAPQATDAGHVPAPAAA